MRFRVQQLDLPHGRIRLFQRTWYLLCTQESPVDEWAGRRVHDLQLGDALQGLGFEDYRDAYEIFQQARAAVREFGLGQGYIEYDLEAQHDRGPVRHRGHPSDPQIHPTPPRRGREPGRPNESELASGQSEWFGQLFLDPASTSSLTLEIVEQVLDKYHPAAVDREASSATVGPGPAAEFHIQHPTESSLNVNLLQDGDLFTVEHPTGVEDHLGESAVEQLLGRLAEVLATTYEVEDTWWKGRLVSTVHRTGRGDETGSPWAGYLHRGGLTVIATSRSSSGPAPSADDRGGVAETRSPWTNRSKSDGDELQ